MSKRNKHNNGELRHAEKENLVEKKKPFPIIPIFISVVEELFSRQRGILIFFVLAFLSVCAISLALIWLAIVFGVFFALIFGCVFYMQVYPHIVGWLKKYYNTKKLSEKQNQAAAVTSLSCMFIIVLSINVAGAILSPHVLPQLLSIDNNDSDDSNVVVTTVESTTEMPIPPMPETMIVSETTIVATPEPPPPPTTLCENIDKERGVCDCVDRTPACR